VPISELTLCEQIKNIIYILDVVEKAQVNQRPWFLRGISIHSWLLIRFLDPLDPVKHLHEFRDPIHTFISVRTDERRVIDSIPFQRLRNIHQLALTYLVYPGATHKRFEHSLGVMELASRIFDVVTDPQNLLYSSVREIVPDEEGKRYWKSAIRMAALCHDLGHLPFSHAAERELLPAGYDHERLTIDIIRSGEMNQIWTNMTPPLRADDIAKLAVGADKAAPLQLNPWEAILSEIIIGDAFGADRMDYLLRDSYHAGVQYGVYDHHRLISSLRILPETYKETDQPALGLEHGGLESSEALMIARHFIYKQVYLHPIRRVYDIHLKDFLKSWLPGKRFSIDLKKHLAISDVDVLSAIGKAFTARNSPQHKFARRIQCREHFHRFYSSTPKDKTGGKLKPGKLRPGGLIADAAEKNFGREPIRYDYYQPRPAAPEFPVRTYDGKVESSLKISQILQKMPEIEVDEVFCDSKILDDAIKWRDQNKARILGLR
jgi:HD superfamily phosphohydrolase